VRIHVTLNNTCLDRCYIYNAFNVHGSVHPNNILIYTLQDAALHTLFYLETALRVSGGTITHHQKRKQLYLQHLAVTATCRYRGR
jgi:hypothetical protein